MKGVGKIKRAPKDVCDFAWDGKNRKSYDDSFIEGAVLHTLLDESDRKITIEHSAYNSGSMMVSNRDFCVARTMGKLDDGSYYILSTSITHKDCPERKGFVRARVQISGWMLRPADDGKSTIVTTVSVVDPAGWIPAAVANAFSGKQPLVVSKLRAILEK
jgi:hypothetical protein